jgi:integrase
MGPKAAEIQGARRRRRLTASHLASLRSESEAYDVADPDCPGLLLHVGAKRADGTPGTRSWHWRFRWRGRRVKLTVGKFPERGQRDAHDLVRTARECLERGIDPRTAGLTRARVAPTQVAGSAVGQTAPHSVAALAAEFMHHYITPRRRRPEYVQRVLDVEVLPRWRTRDARTIKPREVVELIDGIAARGKPSMANKVASIIGQMFRFGVQRALVDTSPVVLMGSPGGIEKPRSRALDDAELAVFLANLDDVYRSHATKHALRALLYTGQRRGELYGAEWRDIDFKTAIWTVRPEVSKTGETQLVPLTAPAVAAFKRLKVRAGRSRFVVPDASGTKPADPKILTRAVARSQKTWKQLKVKRPFVVHDLRRTLRTHLAKLGVEPHVAERVIGHKQRGIIAVYDVHSYLDEKRAALEKWAKHVVELKP